MKELNNHFHKETGICFILAAMLLFSGCACKKTRTNEDLVRYGVSLAQKGYWTEAGMQWRMVLNDDPGNVAALNNLGVAAEVIDTLETAARFLVKAQSLRPEDKQIRANLESLQKRIQEQQKGVDHEESGD